MVAHKTKIVTLFSILIAISAFAVADSYFTLDQGFVFEGYQIMDEDRNSIIEYNSGHNELQSSSNINMNGNSLTNFFQQPCAAGRVVADINDSGGYVCVSVVDESDTAFLNRNGDTMNGTLDMRGNNLEGLATVATESGTVNLQGDLEASGKIKTDTIDMDTGGDMCIGDQCN